MGHDEHGPAYPEPYSCPICGGSEAAFWRCNRPDCLDGRDAAHPINRGRRYFPAFKMMPREEPGDPHLDAHIGPRRSPDYVGMMIFAAIAFGLYWVLHGL